MAIITLSHQHGSRGESIAAGLAARLGYSLVTPAQVDEIIHDRYQLDYSLSGDIGQTPRDSRMSKIFANLISAILTDMAVLNDLVVLECGGQFIFRAFPNAMRVRIVAPKDTRAQYIMEDSGAAFEEALAEIDEQALRHARFLRASFRRPTEAPERYDLVLNTGSLEVDQAVALIVSAAQLRQLATYGMVSSESVERTRMRNQIRLVRSLTKLSLEQADSLKQFAHPSELVFARLLDFYGIRWQYEPRTFPLQYDEHDNIVEGFTPDFYLPDSDLFVELTTMKQSLVTKKNRKVKKLRELYPDVKIQLLYQKDFEDLLFKYAAPQPKEE